MNTHFRKLLLKVCRYIPALTDFRLLVQTKVTYDSLAGRPTDVRQYEHFGFFIVKNTAIIPGCAYRNYRICSQLAMYIVAISYTYSRLCAQHQSSWNQQ